MAIFRQRFISHLHPPGFFVLDCQRSTRLVVSTQARHNSSYHTASHDTSSLWKHTSRRWIFNEAERLKERYVEFDPNELQQEASKAMQDESRSHLVKFAEGGFNKQFLLRTENGQELIARIPTPIAGPPRYTTASEVATLRFLRDIIGIPVPKVLAYSTSANNPVGAEYILMERIHGESLASRWLSLTTEEVKDIMSQIATMEHKLFSFKFPAYGTLYYEHDIPEEAQIQLQMGKFCIGRVAGRQYWHGIRRQVKVDRGPWMSPLDCLTSAARRELACTKSHAKPQPRRTFLLPTDYDIDPSEHVSLLSEFLQLAPSLIPGNSDLNHPVLKHPDLSLGNILLAPGSTRIVSIIDWQDSIVFPLFMQAGYPEFCHHDASKSQSLHIPTLPPDFDTLSPEEEVQAKAQFRLEEANLYYTAATGLHNDKHMSALKLPGLGLRQYLFQQTGYPWDADMINLRAALVGITSPGVWNNISSLPCPLSFMEEEREATMKESHQWNESEQILSRVRDDLGIDLEGGTDPENFEWASHRNLEFRLEMLRQAEDNEREMSWRNWPYKDDGESASPPALGYE